MESTQPFSVLRLTLAFSVLLLLGLLGGCATEWQHHAATTDAALPGSSRNAQRPPALRLQTVQGSTQPDEGFTPITEADLQAGDILFSAEKTLLSASIRLFNHAPVSHAFLYLGDGQIAEAVGAGVQITPFASQRYFCSQFVIEAFNQAGKPLTHTPPEWLNPNDILRMREGDVPAITPIARLNYIGHLQCADSFWNGTCRMAANTRPEVPPSTSLPTP